MIPTHRGGEILCRCLDSLRRHAPQGTEVIVVDDGSTADTVSGIVRAHPGVRYVRLSRQRGFCQAANVGIEIASGNIVELLNDDAEVTAGWARAALRHFATPSVVAVAPLVLYRSGIPENPPRIDSAGDDYDPGGFAWKRGHGRPWDHRLPVLLRRSGPVQSVSGCAAFYRREALLAVGGFDMRFKAYFEDVDLSLRLRQRGGQIIYEPASMVWHIGASSYGLVPRRRLLELQSCNEERLFWKHWEYYGKWHVLPRHLAVLAGKVIRRWSEGTLVPWSFGRIRAWSELIL
ncbi:MAG: glycosyltransferase family 2 protein [Gemmataceae bacterium]|nr:glycosyltransferase family 2 protein [Gemmataceae bacterium]